MKPTTNVVALDPVLPSAVSRPAPLKSTRLRRIGQMPIREIAYRGWQEASKWYERVTPKDGGPAGALLEAQGLALAAPDDALALLRDKVPPRFFPGVDEMMLAGFRARLPEQCDELAAAADDLLDRRFNLLGFRMLYFGDPIDWHLDPVWSRRAPLVHWSCLDPLDPSVVGDSKIVWELNRHQWLVRLAQVHALTGRPRYAEACIGAIDGWLAANPPGLGLNWSSSLEVAYRLISWCWVLMLLRHSPALTGEWTTRLLAAIWLHATHIRRYLSYYFSPNTHLTGEALGLFYAGTLFTEFRDAARWRDLGARILVSESHVQVCTDGVHFERSTCYHRYTAEIYLHFLLLSARNGFGVPGHVAEGVRRMVDFLLAIAQPDRSLPPIGDGDGGDLLPLAQRSPSDSRGIFATAACVFKDPELVWAAGTLAPEVLWLLGDEGCETFERLPAAEPAAVSRVFPSGGYAVMRSGWEPDAHQLIVDIGPLGCPVSSGHGHADLLSVQCSVFGEPCLVDAGTFCYTASAEWRDYFRSTAAHSALMVDRQNQAEPSGPFGWIGRPRVRLRNWHSEPRFDFLDADHDAYLGLPDPVSHRRRVIFVKPSYWILIDDICGLERHRIDLAFQFAPIAVKLSVHPWARAETPRGNALWVASFPSAPVQASLACGEVSPIRGWISTAYGQREPAPMLQYSCTVRLPWRMLTILLPDPQRLASPPDARPIFDELGVPSGIAFDHGRRSVRFDEREILVTGE